MPASSVPAGGMTLGDLRVRHDAGVAALRRRALSEPFTSFVGPRGNGGPAYASALHRGGDASVTCSDVAQCAGEHVAVEPIISCGHCRYCEGGAYNCQQCGERSIAVDEPPYSQLDGG